MMFRFVVVLTVLTTMPKLYHSLGLDFSQLIDPGNYTIGKSVNELCEYFCNGDEDDDDLFEDLMDEPRPRILCWICHKKGLPTKKPTSSTTVPTMSTTTSKTTTTTTTPSTTSTTSTTTTTSAPPTTSTTTTTSTPSTTSTTTTTSAPPTTSTTTITTTIPPDT